MAAIKALELWCKTQCDGYRDVAITNMTTSFRSGLAFCALIHKYRPDLIDYDSLRKEDVFENNRLAFWVAEDKLGIPALLDAEDMVALRVPDRLSILTYVSQYYNYFRGRTPMGGVKRPAEGSKEEPSEKKNLPVAAKTFAPKTTPDKCVPSTLTAPASPKVTRAAAQKAVLAENANKSGTLNSKCAACRSHVHLVQRHFVDGKLYHRSCFKCSECSGVLHAGGYRAGKNPDTFICNTHHNSCNPSSSDAGTKNTPTGSAARPNGATRNQPASRPSSVLSAPLNVVRNPNSPPAPPAPPAPPSPSWTASAQKTQVARQRFFQAAPSVSESSADNRKSAEFTDILAWSKVQLSSNEERSRSRTAAGKTLAEANCNNNNKRPFTVRSAERRFEPSPDKCSEGPTGNWAGRPTARQTNNKESPGLEVTGRDDTGPTTVHTSAPVCREEQSKIKPLRTELRLKMAARSPSPPAPSQPPVSVAEQRPQPTSVNLGSKHSPVKPPSRRPAVESAGFSTPTSADHGRASGAKKGKYLSPADACRSETRSPSVRTYHIPVEQIERELNDIETNLAQLEKEGVELEKKLRCCEEEGEGDILMDPLMVDWFKLIRKKQMIIRKESELVYIARTQELEQQQPGVEGELRRLLEKPDHLKSGDERQQETLLMQRLVEIVNGRNAILEGLDEDRLREVEEDQQLNEMMKNLGVKKAKSKRKTSISKLFRRRSKRRVE
ncbi:MICAL-like protein 2a isoform X2 [Solea solea]|uniref:MICAL-like protein 2a isoform X2 n=1 Tax=Solea solea TaxID=90069 RepID=UPI00272C590F|nr:MICAL-like protein 2a isoform X2 [Solea solea]